MTRSGVPNGWNGRHARKKFAAIFTTEEAGLPEWVESIARTGGHPPNTHFVAKLDTRLVYLFVKPTKIGTLDCIRERGDEGVAIYVGPNATAEHLRNRLVRLLDRARRGLLANAQELQS